MSQNASYLQRPDPDLPICVEQTVLVWLPLAFLWLCAPWHFTTLCKKPAKAPLSKLYICKQVTLTIQQVIKKAEQQVPCIQQCHIKSNIQTRNILPASVKSLKTPVVSAHSSFLWTSGGVLSPVCCIKLFHSDICHNRDNK